MGAGRPYPAIGFRRGPTKSKFPKFAKIELVDASILHQIYDAHIVFGSIPMDRHLQIACRAWCKFDPWSVGFKSNQGCFQTAHDLFGWCGRKNHGKATQGARKRTAKKWDITYVVGVRRPWVGSKGSRDTSHGQRTSLGPKLRGKSAGNIQGAPDLGAQRRLIKAKKRKKEKKP